MRFTTAQCRDTMKTARMFGVVFAVKVIGKI
jgi:hypothetical protein